MAITFTQEKKKQQYLIFVLIGIIFIILIVLRFGVFRETEVPPESFLPSPEYQEIEMNFGLFQKTDFKELRPPEEIPAFGETEEEGEIGRKNPFVPY